MRFGEYFASGRGLVTSFEVFPPKTDKAQAQLEATLPRLVALDPSYMTVTYGAFGTTQQRTLDVAKGIRAQYGLDTASHLTCVGASRAELDAILDQLAAGDIENIVALRGDPPEGEESFSAVEGGFAYANELVEHLRARGDFGIAVAGYPEKHIEAPDLATDLGYLKQKVDAGADIVVTQLFYDNRDFIEFEAKARALRVTVPIVPGLLPIQSFKQILRITALCGARVPEKLHAELEAAGDDTNQVREIGVRWCIEQCRGLIEHGVPGIHFYVLNRALPMERIVGELRASGHLPASKR
jgi:methylenetetrahydrofolate reductase (NADPH)